MFFLYPTESERRCIITNYKTVVEELDNGIIRESLNRCRSVSEDLKRAVLPAGGNLRRKRAHEFLKFILNDDINVLSFLIVAKENGLDEFIHLQKTTEPSTPFISNLFSFYFHPHNIYCLVMNKCKI